MQQFTVDFIKLLFKIVIQVFKIMKCSSMELSSDLITEEMQSLKAD